ncbi:MAG: hypothetical protein A2Y62_22135 [Candidatus Fischerbacteria bacterium RBG_13_37_8]|uniref:Doubled CXXCH motif domain-containing protein n=1 Tax=Candidatus Fischerbacteria bacterium RBG_13_37_8 TaxID=1817863 RepID=A0A1F5VX85_9BACT|nr:MAG: hypothetical protein A2Y62_22135 [Candidatus Fischerbacteria bacterium RBG_13_37_8]
MTGTKSNRITIYWLLVPVIMVYMSSITWSTDYPHNFEWTPPANGIQCTNCHRVKNAPGGRLTLVGGNVNMCVYCHDTGKWASHFPFAYGNQSLPGTSGTSHGFERQAVQSGYDATAPLDPNMALFLELEIINGNPACVPPGCVACSVCHDSHNHSIAFPFLRKGKDQICAQCHAAREQTVSPYTSHPVKKAIPVNPNYQTPPHLELINNKADCLTCHGMHYTYSNMERRGIAESGTTTCLTDNDATWVDNQYNGWELQIGITTNPDRYNWRKRRTITSTNGTTKTICWTDVLPDSVVATDPYIIKNISGTGDGFLLHQTKESLCTQCHKFPATGSHFTSANVIWPGGQYGSTYAHTDPTSTELWPPGRSGGSYNRPLPSSFQGSCYNCHWPHGWPNGSGGKYTNLKVDTGANLCYTCHDGNPASTNIKSTFENPNWVILAVGNWNNLNLNNHHDVNASDQTQSGAIIGCSNCHDPHLASSSSPPGSYLISDPDPTDGRFPAPGNSWTGSDWMSEWCLDCHDGSFPPEITPPSTQLMNILDSHTAGGSYGTDAMGTATGNASIKPGYGWATNDTLPCNACHEINHTVNNNYFGLKQIVMSKDGTTPVPSDCGTGYSMTNNSVRTITINGYCWCNTCHTNSMGNKKDNCFECHYHSTRF